MQAISLLINFTLNSSVTVRGCVIQWSQSGGPGFEPHPGHLRDLLDPSLYSPERTSAVIAAFFFQWFVLI